MSGLYGKLPAHGDFVARGISVAVRRQLDLWLTKVAGFALPESGLRGQITLGSDIWLVFVLPSHDRPGRQFPIAMLCQFAINDHVAADAWCDAALSLYLQDTRRDAEGLFAVLPPPPVSDLDMPATDALWFAGQLPCTPEAFFNQLSSG